MTLNLITNSGELLKGERQFSLVGDEDPETNTELVVSVHPWSRFHGNGAPDESVFLSVGWFTRDGDEPEDLENPAWNIIVDRADFVAGLLHAFPELKRAE